VIHLLCPDDDAPSGGIRKLYRHADLLNALGRHAAVRHLRPGFRCSWFPNDTPITYGHPDDLRPPDVLVVPEVYGPALGRLAPGVPKVVFNQNCYNTFRGFGLDPRAAPCPYDEPEVVAVITVSEDSRAYLEYALPRLPVHRVRYAIDPEMFFPDETARRPRLGFMPRKNAADAEQVLHLLARRGALDGWELLPLHGLAEPQVAGALRTCAMFLSFGHPEGFGLPAAEAMACGCLVVGYHGQGGREFLTPELGVPIDAGDVLGLVRAAARALAGLRAGDPRLLAMARKGSAFVRGYYSPAAERADIQRAWDAILGPV
jgi:glycosyltransferase involved in cell wall biosynthesis